LSDFNEILRGEAVFHRIWELGQTDTGVPQNVFFCFPNAVWASIPRAGAFRIASDTLVIRTDGLQS